MYMYIVRPTSVTVILHWNFGDLIKASGNYSISIIITQLPDRDHTWFIHRSPTHKLLLVPFKLTPGKAYEVKVVLYQLSKFKNRVGYCTVKCHAKTFRAEYTEEEFYALYERTLQFIANKGLRMQPCDYIYRNKSLTYFEDIRISSNGVMAPYFKTFNGSPENYINGWMKGLFFTASHIPSTTSPFGPRRLYIPATTLITKFNNLYFADFYCNKNRHKVTLVMTEIGTEQDRYCQRKMIPLDKFNNPFLMLITDVYDHGWLGLNIINKVIVNDNSDVVIELFYTGSINLHFAIMHGSYFETVSALHNCTPQNIFKNKNCKICTLPSN